MNPRTCRGLFLVQERTSYGTKVTRVIRKWIEVNETSRILQNNTQSLVGIGDLVQSV